MRLRHSAATAMLRRLHHQVLRPTELQTARLDSFMTFTGFSFGQHGWHHLIQLLKQVERNPTLTPDQSVLFRFHERYQPESTCELVRHREDGISFKTTPWNIPMGLISRRFWPELASGAEKLGGKPVLRSYAARPREGGVSVLPLALFRDFQRQGYQPWRFGFVGGTLLRRLDGSTRFVVLQGNHRAAILSHLGYDSILVAPVKGRHIVINERDAASWHYVRTGQCTESDALAYFNAFFELTGVEQAERFGLVPPDPI